MKLTYGSLFSGVGGFDAGFDLAGFQCAFQVEWDKHCQQILAKHWPEVPKWSDVQEVNGAEIPPCDVLIFGSPCQDLSVAGKRAGLDGDKSIMFYEAIRIIKEMRNATGFIYPRIVVWENVPGAITSNNGDDFGQVLNTMADIGAVQQEWSVLDAVKFGIPQRRRRLFLISIFSPDAVARCPDPLLPVKAGRIRRSTSSRKKEQEDAIVVEARIEEDCRPIAFSHTQGLDLQASYEAFPTLRREGSGHAVAVVTDDHEMIIRRLTPLECERLQGWPDDHTRWRADGKEQAETQRYKQCGNGVATPVAAWVAKHVKAIL
jgi:DNA (cytosine-5)-methyltransferase 1